MKKALIAIACGQIIGCASVKYPNWEQVNIEPSVINKPCESKFWLEEQCFDDDCNSWFKKRATIYGANTVVRHGNSASYFYCTAGSPHYQNPERTTKDIDVRNGIAYFPNEIEPFTGKYEGYYPNGQKLIEEYYRNGKKDGLRTFWLENGQKKGETNFKNGVENGLDTYYENGKKAIQHNYKDGKKNGLETVWHENGQKKGEQNYIDGKQVGLTTFWDEGGHKFGGENEKQKTSEYLLETPVTEPITQSSPTETKSVATEKQIAGSPTFAGVRWGASKEEAIKQLTAKGFTIGILDKDGDLRFGGTLIGFRIVGIVIFGNNKVLKIFVRLDTPDNEAIKTYRSMKNTLLEKYGTPSNDFEFFSKPYYNGDGYEEQAIRLAKAIFSCYWKGLYIEITESLKVDVTYESPLWHGEVVKRKARSTSVF